MPHRSPRPYFLRGRCRMNGHYGSFMQPGLSRMWVTCMEYMIFLSSALSVYKVVEANIPPYNRIRLCNSKNMILRQFEQLQNIVQFLVLVMTSMNRLCIRCEYNRSVNDTTLRVRGGWIWKKNKRLDICTIHLLSLIAACIWFRVVILIWTASDKIWALFLCYNRFRISGPNKRVWIPQNTLDYRQPINMGLWSLAIGIEATQLPW